MFNLTKTQPKIALPSKGMLETGALDFLAAAGLRVHRPNPRQYVATMPAIPGMAVLFQRAHDIVGKVSEGSADFGITGFDIVAELADEHRNIVMMVPTLGFGYCQLVVAVPETWLDVAAVEDLADLAADYRQQNRELRIATKYRHLTQKWFYEKGIMNFTLLEMAGALEAAPSIEYADFIVDITSTGTTLRENRLKQIQNGTIIESEACFIANRTNLLRNPEKLAVAKHMLELIDAHLRAKKFINVTANICGPSPQAISEQIMRQRDLAGLRGPSVSPIYSQSLSGESWHTVSVIIPKNKLMAAVNHLRNCGAEDVMVSPLNFVFERQSSLYEALLARLDRAE